MSRKTVPLNILRPLRAWTEIDRSPAKLPGQKDKLFFTSSISPRKKGMTKSNYRLLPVRCLVLCRLCPFLRTPSPPLTPRHEGEGENFLHDNLGDGSAKMGAKILTSGPRWFVRRDACQQWGKRLRDGGLAGTV